MRRFMAALFACLLLGAFGCGGDGGGGNTTTDAGHDSGPVDSGPTSFCPTFDNITYPTATQFCTEYGTTCGFGTANYYASMSACVTSYQAALDAAAADAGATGTGVGCRTNHFCFVTTPGPSVHCEHAAGSSLCQ